MKLWDTWYCHLCGKRLPADNSLCPACTAVRRKEAETKCKELVAEGKQKARRMNPQEAIEVLMGVAEQASSQEQKHALALAAYALSRLDSSKKHQSS
jgi:hypothetical protein